MPRPKKWRKVCCMPENASFGPLDNKKNGPDTVFMIVEEFETIRLIDLEGMTQEECATQMNVARTTVQRIYNDARKKLAISLVEGSVLRIEGGDYKLCTRDERDFGCGKNRRCQQANPTVMNE